MNVLTALLLEGFADSSFARLFTEMNAITIVLFVLGLIFCAIEMFVPGFGFFGISGTVMIVAGIIARMISGGDVYMLLYMVLIALVLFILMFWLLSRLITKSKLAKTPLFNVQSAVPEGATEGTRNFSALVGQVGVAQTPLRPVGKAMFDGDTVDVVARDGFIAEGTLVVVLSVEGQRVVVIESKDNS